MFAVLFSDRLLSGRLVAAGEFVGVGSSDGLQFGSCRDLVVAWAWAVRRPFRGR